MKKTSKILVSSMLMVSLLSSPTYASGLFDISGWFGSFLQNDGSCGANTETPCDVH